MINKRQKRQTKIDFVELKGQNVNGSATGLQEIFIEQYDCDAEEITKVKHYELNKISTCKFKPLDLDMTKTEVQLLSKAQAVEIKAFAVAGTIKERVEFCSQHTDYIRAKRPSYYVSDAQRTKILDADEVRNELARINLLKNTRYKPTRYNISFNYIANPPLQKKIEDMHKTKYDDIYVIYEYGFKMHTGQKVTKKKNKFDDEKFIKIKPKQIISEKTRYEDEDNKHYYYGFVNENTHLNMKMDLYMSNINSRISLQAIEFYSQICEQTRIIR